MPRRRQDLGRFDPFARPDRRWREAARVVERKARLSRNADPILKTAVSYLRRRAVVEATGRRRKGSGDDSIRAAMKLHEAGGLTVAEVQARLLSGQDDQQIAERCGLTPGCIAWYTALFFDVRSRLDAFGYIVARVIGPGPWQGFENHDVPGFWTWMAWAGGSLVLDLLVDTFHAVRRPHEVSALSVYLRPGKTVPRDLQCLVAAAVLPHIDSAGIALMPLQLGLLEAKVARDPVKAERQRDRVRRNLVRLAREHLAGKPITMPLPAKARGKATTTNRSSATAARGNAAPPPKTFLQELWETLSRRAAAGRGNKSSTLDVVPERASGAQRERVAQHRGGHRRGLGATTQRQAVLLSRPPRR